MWYTHTHTMDTTQAIKKNEILPFAVTDGPRGYYAKYNKSDKDKYCMVSFTCGIKK